jgi:hypothetical protein
MESALTRRNADETFCTTFQTLALDTEEVDRALSKAGFLPYQRPGMRWDEMPRTTFERILALNPEHERMVRRSEAMFHLKSFKEFVNPNTGDIVSRTDYDIRVPSETFVDPAIDVIESEPGTTSEIVKEIICVELLKKFVKVSLSQGTSSRRAKRCVIELASLMGARLELALDECLSFLREMTFAGKEEFDRAMKTFPKIQPLKSEGPQTNAVTAKQTQVMEEMQRIMEQMVELQQRAKKIYAEHLVRVA